MDSSQLRTYQMMSVGSTEEVLDMKGLEAYISEKSWFPFFQISLVKSITTSLTCCPASRMAQRALRTVQSLHPPTMSSVMWDLGIIT
ncbi:hypothetical protein SK128_011628, partial [Halocaridina rubra]